MSYFAPYIDASGLHLPTYEERLEELTSAYRSIFGVESELSASMPDYQLLSVFAKALDDVSALVLQAYNSRNPAYAAGQALDLLLPQYGITREAGETDASIRARIRHSCSARTRLNRPHCLQGRRHTMNSPRHPQPPSTRGWTCRFRCIRPGPRCSVCP